MRLRRIILFSAAVTAMLHASVRAAKPHLTTLHTFSGQNGDGANPDCTLAAGKDGVLYGTTQSGGANGAGTVFSLTPPVKTGGAWTEAILWNFGGSGDGSSPSAGVVIGSGGTLYGTTEVGGANGHGTVFAMSPPATSGGAWAESVLWSFDGAGDGAYSAAPLAIGSSGELYGTTYEGGSSGQGAVFRLVPPASAGAPWTETVLYSFTGQPDGWDPMAGVAIGGNGVLYGTTYLGGDTGSGTAYSLTPPATPGGAWTENILWSFSEFGRTLYDTFPQAPFVIGPDGVLYTTTFGTTGLHPIGAVVALVPPSAPGGSWTETVLYRFRHRPTKPYWGHGAHPTAGVLQSKNGDLYGTTSKGGAYGSGTVFKLLAPSTPGGAWKHKILHSFTKAAGQRPLGGLVMDRHGTFYGTTSTGGSQGYGTVFALTQ